MTPTQRSLAKLRAEGWLPEVVEKWIPRANIRKDLFGFIDIVAIKEGETLGVQATSYSHVSERVTKIAESEHVGMVRKAGWRIEVWGWHKKGARWECRIVDVS